MKWRDIESAPKDGTRILAFASRYGWESDGSAPVVAAHSYGNWWVMGAIAKGFDSKDTCQPTHWMPLPEPPPL